MDINPLEILKWGGVVFAAGFIGYFGRHLSMLLIDRVHKRKPPQSITAESTRAMSVNQDNKLEESQLKLEKKKAKGEAKKAKKEKKH